MSDSSLLEDSNRTAAGAADATEEEPPMTSLFESYRLARLDLPNRIVMAPMTRARATAEGLPTASAALYYAQRASAGLIISEGVQPSLQGQSNPSTPGLHTDEQVAAWRPVTGAVHTAEGEADESFLVGHAHTGVDDLIDGDGGRSPGTPRLRLLVPPQQLDRAD